MAVQIEIPTTVRLSEYLKLERKVEAIDGWIDVESGEAGRGIWEEESTEKVYQIDDYYAIIIFFYFL